MSGRRQIYINGMNRIIIAETESEVTAAVREKNETYNRQKES